MNGECGAKGCDDDEFDEYFRGTSMHKLSSHFDNLATGSIQVPTKNLTSDFRDDFKSDRLARFHDVMVDRAGPLFTHFLASVPFVLEELCRVGVALQALALKRGFSPDHPFLYHDLDAFDGSAARALADCGDGLISTVTNSPNLANRATFDAHASPSHSKFVAGPYANVARSYALDLCPSAEVTRGFDCIYEMAAFQFYGVDRHRHVAHVFNLLEHDGFAFFLEKVNQPEPSIYHQRELLKDEVFKRRYFSEQEIAWKREAMLVQMNDGQIMLEELTDAIATGFAGAYLLWKSTNFYEVVASNDLASLESFVASLGQPIIDPRFIGDKPACRRLL